jgi:hypothetical protein
MRPDERGGPARTTSRSFEGLPPAGRDADTRALLLRCANDAILLLLNVPAPDAETADA